MPTIILPDILTTEPTTNLILRKIIEVLEANGSGSGSGSTSNGENIIYNITGTNSQTYNGGELHSIAILCRAGSCTIAQTINSSGGTVNTPGISGPTITLREGESISFTDMNVKLKNGLVVTGVDSTSDILITMQS